MHALSAFFPLSPAPCLTPLPHWQMEIYPGCRPAPHPTPACPSARLYTPFPRVPSLQTTRLLPELIAAAAAALGVAASRLSFMFDGTNLGPTDSPKSLGLEPWVDDDEEEAWSSIDALVRA